MTAFDDLFDELGRRSDRPAPSLGVVIDENRAAARDLARAVADEETAIDALEEARNQRCAAEERSRRALQLFHELMIDEVNA